MHTPGFFALFSSFSLAASVFAVYRTEDLIRDADVLEGIYLRTYALGAAVASSILFVCCVLAFLPRCKQRATFDHVYCLLVFVLNAFILAMAIGMLTLDQTSLDDSVLTNWSSDAAGDHVDVKALSATALRHDVGPNSVENRFHCCGWSANSNAHSQNCPFPQSCRDVIYHFIRSYTLPIGALLAALSTLQLLTLFFTHVLDCARGRASDFAHLDTDSVRSAEQHHASRPVDDCASSLPSSMPASSRECSGNRTFMLSPAPPSRAASTPGAPYFYYDASPPRYGSGPHIPVWSTRTPTRVLHSMQQPLLPQ